MSNPTIVLQNSTIFCHSSPEEKIVAILVKVMDLESLDTAVNLISTKINETPTCDYNTFVILVNHDKMGLSMLIPITVLSSEA